jgi:hypothetical protein
VEYQRLTPSRQNPAVAIAGLWPNVAALLAGTPMQILVSQADQASSLIETLSIHLQDTWRPAPRLALTYGVRWEITPAPSIRQTVLLSSSANSGTAPPSDPPNPPGTGTGTAPPPYTTGTTTAQGVPLWPTRYTQVAPRIGVAYRLTDHSALRAGWGIFYDAGFSVATDPINGFPYNRWQFGGVPTTTGGVSQPAGETFTPNLKLPYTQEWHVAWEQEVAGAGVVAVSYLGSAGRRLLRREAGMLASGMASYSVATNDGVSDFHAMEVTYRRRLARGVEAIAGYSWGHSIDNGSWDSAVLLTAPGYPAGRDRGASSFDVRQSFSTALTFDSRGLGRAGLMRRLTADWKMQAIARARSGFPIDVLESQNPLGFGWDDYRRPDLVPGVALWIADAGVPGGRRLNLAAFAVAAGLQGTLGRDAITGFGMFQADAALRRRFPLADSGSLEIGLACFNLANHANPADPVRYLDSPFFGQPVSMLSLMLGNGSPRSGLTPAFQLGSPRSVELGVKLRF